MTERLNELAAWMAAPEENEHLEFKEAKNRYDFEELIRYCAALANEGGGHLILGITDRRPRRVVGTAAFEEIERTKAGLIERLHLRIDAEIVPHPEGRVVVFRVPSRPLGMPIQYRGAYWMRGGEALIPMTTDQLRRILDETGPDFSAEICRGAVLSDLDSEAVALFGRAWVRRSGNVELARLAPEQLLADAELVVDRGVTYAALILLGTRAALGRHLPQAEVIFEYRTSESSIPSQDREEYRLGFLRAADALWSKINLRNEVQQLQDGLFIWDIRTFNETVVREAILNAVSHRDYRLAGSIFVRQFPRSLEIVSPGGFLPGITPQNVLWRQAPRNRRIAEALSKCGLVERAGQGMNRMFGDSIKEGKHAPDFIGSDDYQVAVSLRGDIQDFRFLRFLEQIGQEKLSSFGLPDLLALDLLYRKQTIPSDLKPRLDFLTEQGIVERLGRGRSARYILAQKLYRYLGEEGSYTRTRGLDRETNKALLVRHLEINAVEGSQLRELLQVLPALSRDQVQTLLKELKREGRAVPRGRTRGGKWYPGFPSNHASQTQ